MALSTVEPQAEDVAGFATSLERYTACLPVERTAGDCFVG